MNNYEQLIKQIIDKTPSWEKDGGGVRGRTIAPLMGGSSGIGTFEELQPQIFNQQKNEIFNRQDEPLPELILQSTSEGGGNVPPHPWQILLRTTEESGTEYKIESASRLYSSLSSWNNIEVDGIGTWNGVSEGYVILFGVVDGGICTEASIQIQETLSDRIDVVDNVQNSFAVQLGYIYQEGDSFLVRQNAFHNFTIVDSCSGGSTFIYPIPT